MQSQNFDVITTHTIDGDVVLVQDQFTCAWNTASLAHARVSLELGHRALQFRHETGRPDGVVFGDMSSDFINLMKR